MKVANLSMLNVLHSCRSQCYLTYLLKSDRIRRACAAYAYSQSAAKERNFPDERKKKKIPNAPYLQQTDNKIFSKTAQAEMIVPEEATEVSSKDFSPTANSWHSTSVNRSNFPDIYFSLSKSRLTGLVVSTALAGYVLAPMPLSVASLVGVCAGTALISASANTVNQILEAPYDAQMHRTAQRVLVKGFVTPQHAAGFAVVCVSAGLTTLLLLCGPVTASLGAANVLLYTAVYTPLKRVTIANTWLGAIVGAVPPVMGWCASGAPLLGPQCWGAWVMATLLFAWQFPHFNALSWNLRQDYCKAGYRMMCVANPRLCKVTCVRHSLVLCGLSLAAPLLGVTSWTFAVDSLPFNAYILYLSYRFYWDSDSGSARKLFRFSLLHLPALLLLMIISKNWNQTSNLSNSALVLETANEVSCTNITDASVNISNQSIDMETTNNTVECATKDKTVDNLAKETNVLSVPSPLQLDVLVVR